MSQTANGQRKCPITVFMQGDRIVSGQDCEQVTLVPASHEMFGLDADPRSALLTQQIESTRALDGWMSLLRQHPGLNRYAGQ